MKIPYLMHPMTLRRHGGGAVTALHLINGEATTHQALEWGSPEKVVDALVDEVRSLHQELDAERRLPPLAACDPELLRLSWMLFWFCCGGAATMLGAFVLRLAALEAIVEEARKLIEEI